MATANPLTQPRTSADYLSSPSPTSLPTDTRRTVGGSTTPAAPNMSTAPLMSVAPTPSQPAIVTTSSPVQAVYDRQTAAASRDAVRAEAAKTQPTVSGFTSTNPTTQATIAEMQRQAVAQSSQAPAPAPAPATPAAAPTPETPPGKEPWGRTGTEYRNGKWVYEEQRWNPSLGKFETVVVDSHTGKPADFSTPKPASDTSTTTSSAAPATTAPGASTSSEAFLQQYLTQMAGLGTMTEDEKASVFAAGEAARAQYQPYIDEAKQEKKQGMAKGLIAGGQAGGFMNTQIAGVGALSQTEGGTFVGAGGSLSRMQDAYSAAIGRLESAQQVAINQAMQQRELAIKTGKQENLKAMRDAFDMAQKIADEKRQVANDGLTRLLTLQQLKKYERETAMETFKSLSEAGIDVDDEYFEDLDAVQGAPRGTYRALWDVQQDVNAAKKIEDANARRAKDLENADKLINIADKMGVNVPINVGGVQYTYQGVNTAGMKTGTEQTADGRVTYWQVDPRTKAVSTVDLGYIGTGSGWTTQTDDNGNIWRVNAASNQMVPFFPSRSQESIQEVFPEMSVSPFVDANGKPRVQCGEFVNDLTGVGVGDSFESKMAKMDLWKRGEGDPASVINSLQVGDVFTQKLNTWTGHVGVVLGVETSPSGVAGIRALESNYTPGKVTSTRFIPLDQIDGFGKAKQISPLLQTGTDKPQTGTQAPTFGGKAPASAAPVQMPSFEEWVAGAEKELAKDPNVTQSNPEALRRLYDSTVGAAPSYLDAATNLTFKMTDKKGPIFISDVRKSLESGDFLRAQEKLKKAALDTADTTTSQQVRGRDNGLRALQAIERDLAEYQNAGGNLGIFAGTAEQVAAKAGAVGDPARRRIATKIAGAIADYRKSISGAAFTESEKAEYDAMFPSILNGSELNAANIQAMKEVFMGANESFYRQQIGNENYDAIFGL